MSNETRAWEALREAEASSTIYPWGTVYLLVKAVVLALLAIAVAIEAATPGEP